MHDLLRLGRSLATAARSADLPGVITSRMAEALVDGYEHAFDDARTNETKRTQRPAVVQVAMKKAQHQSRRKLDRQTIEGVVPRIPLGERFWPLLEDEAKAVCSLFEPQSGLDMRGVLGPATTGDTRIEVLDAAFWVKGCSSLGRRRYAVLLDIDGECSAGGPPCLVDIKEMVLRLSEDFPEDPVSPVASVCRTKLEGIIGKRGDAPYRSERARAGASH
ncbi:uncharacterized protein (DUF2252 family) [Paraburkholderia sp. UCT70]|uniref:DUF2252 family protein n=1 Tax=Paraburkholderia sp. UCT70 TaxID=2991068 RepID=UPI003D2508AF